LLNVLTCIFLLVLMKLRNDVLRKSDDVLFEEMSDLGSSLVLNFIDHYSRPQELVDLLLLGLQSCLQCSLFFLHLFQLLLKAVRDLRVNVGMLEGIHFFFSLLEYHLKLFYFLIRCEEVEPQFIFHRTEEILRGYSLLVGQVSPSVVQPIHSPNPHFRTLLWNLDLVLRQSIL
jgi:hypothetical protein